MIIGDPNELHQVVELIKNAVFITSAYIIIDKWIQTD